MRLEQMYQSDPRSTTSTRIIAGLRIPYGAGVFVNPIPATK